MKKIESLAQDRIDFIEAMIDVIESFGSKLSVEERGFLGIELMSKLIFDHSCCCDHAAKIINSAINSAHENMK